LKFLLDTNTVIYAYKNLGQVRVRWAATSFEDVALCSVSLFELEFGLSKSSHPEPLRKHIDGLRNRHPIVGLDEAAARQAGRIRGALAAAGTPIGPYDLLIAGIALTHDLTLVTRNTEEFRRVGGLKLEDWFD
jgi:tRNA(fMet)-specific endonuclease VapC